MPDTPALQAAIGQPAGQLKWDVPIGLPRPRRPLRRYSLLRTMVPEMTLPVGCRWLAYPTVTFPPRMVPE